MLDIPYFRQTKDFTCGPACVEMVHQHYFGKRLREEESELSIVCKTSKKKGTRHLALINAFKFHGLKVHVKENAEFNDLRHFIRKRVPVVVNYIEPTNNEGHYSVVVGLSRGKIIMNDLWNGRNFRMNAAEFHKRWKDNGMRWMVAVEKKPHSLPFSVYYTIKN